MKAKKYFLAIAIHVIKGMHFKKEIKNNFKFK